VAIKIQNSTIIDDGRNIVDAGITTVSALNISTTEVISSARQLKNIASLDATTTATIEAAIANSPNTFTDLNVTGIATFSDVNITGVVTATEFYKNTIPLITGVGISSDSTRVSTGITDFNFVGAEVTSESTTATVTIQKTLTLTRRDAPYATLNSLGAGIPLIIRNGSTVTLLA
jgi:hypothetical protein